MRTHPKIGTYHPNPSVATPKFRIRRLTKVSPSPLFSETLIRNRYLPGVLPNKAPTAASIIISKANNTAPLITNITLLSVTIEASNARTLLTNAIYANGDHKPMSIIRATQRYAGCTKVDPWFSDIIFSLKSHLGLFMIYTL